METIPTWGFNLSMKGPTFTAKQAMVSRPYIDQEMVDVLVSYLRENDLVAFSRPSHHHDVEQPFVLERVQAQKAIFDLKGDVGPHGLTEISVWVSPPAPQELTGLRYSQGTYLYLLEEYWKADAKCRTTRSGFSAFNAIVTELMQASVLHSVPKPFLGVAALVGKPPWYKRYQWDYYDLSPLESLEKLGADVQPSRAIETLYRKRYLTDEQHFSDKSGPHRSNDLFAYPIFIREDDIASNNGRDKNV